MNPLYFLLGVFGITSCGRVPLEHTESRIIGGVDAPDNYAPHIVSLAHQSFFLAQVCGGSIISQRLVLTAAHCITPFVQDGKLSPAFYGRVGSNIWFSGGTVITFKSYHIHPDWDEVNIKNDGGLLVMTDLLKLSERVGLIKVEMGWVGGNEPSYVTGWGRTGPTTDGISVNLAPTPDNMQKLNVSTITTKQCRAMLADPEFSMAPDIDENVEICTFHSVGHGNCNGDSGSALVSYDTGCQIGIISWGIACAIGAPDVYARLSGLTMQLFIMGKMEEFGNQ